MADVNQDVLDEATIVADEATEAALEIAEDEAHDEALEAEDVVDESNEVAFAAADEEAEDADDGEHYYIIAEEIAEALENEHLNDTVVRSVEPFAGNTLFIPDDYSELIK